MRALLLLIAAALALTACPKIPPPPINDLSSFKVVVLGVFMRDANGARQPLAVHTSCASRYGGQAMVPADVKGQAGCRYVIPHSEIEIDIEATALDLRGEPLRTFNGPVSFRVLPGDLSGEYKNRWGLCELGTIKATVKALHQYGKVRVWVEDAPPKPIYDAGVMVGSPADLPPEVAHTFAAGTSDILYFDDQTLQSLQVPDGFDNRSSQFVGEFVVVGKNPESGETLTQSCEDDAVRDGKPAMMVVTGLDPSGFFVTDISACRLEELTKDSTGATQVRTPEPPEYCQVALADGGVANIEETDAGVGQCEISHQRCARRSECKSFIPGTFASMFVYNYNYPDGLDEGDLIFTLSGSIQEFTSTTQLVFPAWTVAERVRRLPVDQWDKWLKYAKPYRIGGRTCGWDNAAPPFLTDQLCGQNRRNLKMESLESGLVKLTQLRFPDEFVNCDFDANGSVPFFCEQRDQDGNWFWGSCAFGEVEPENDRLERECTQSCVLGVGDHWGKVCSEERTFTGFGQYVVELAPAGPGAVGLDDSLPARFASTEVVREEVSDAGFPDGGAMLTDGGVPRTFSLTGYGAGIEVAIICTAPTRFRPTLQTDKRPIDANDRLLGANEIVRHSFALNGSENTVLFGADTSAPAQCSVGWNSKARINLVTKDALPELNPNCRTDDPDDDKAQQCRYLHAATFDVTGHLRHVQPARPRWLVLPRAPDDVCCHPGPGLQCPRPVKPCK